MMLARLCAVAALLAACSGGPAAAATCTLGLMASLDMTIGGNGLPTVPVTLNGTDYEFAIDTAGVYSKISGSLVEKLGLRQAPANVEIYSPQGMVRANSVDIASLKLGNNEARHFHLMVGNDINMPRNTDGVLAGDLLMLFDVEFDFAKGKLNLFSQDHCPGKVVYWTQSGYAEVPFHLATGPIPTNDHISFNMTLDGHELTTDFDTGSNWTWIRRKAASEVFGLDSSSPGVTRISANDSKDPVYGKQFQLLQIGGIAVHNPAIEIIDDHFEDEFRMAHPEKSRDDPIYGAHLGTIEQLTIGMNVISKLHVFIAYKEHTLYVTAADAH